MKFLTKKADSEIYTQGYTYKINGDNSILRGMLLLEQNNFCAYSEKYIEELDAVEVEHFNPSLKGNDDYFNYYTALRECNANNKKMYPVYQGSSFFDTLFFQNRQEFNSIIEYQKGQYQEINQTDTEAIELIAFLGFNRTPLHKQRQNHIKRLKEVFDNGNYSETQRLEHFRKHRQDLNFITAIENELELDLSEFYN